MDEILADVKTTSVPESKLLATIVNNQSELGLREKDGILIFETEPLHNIDFAALIEQSRDERTVEQFSQNPIANHIPVAPNFKRPRTSEQHLC